MTVNDFHQAMKDYGNELLAKYGLDDCIKTCGQFRSNKNLTFCLKFRDHIQNTRCDLGDKQKKSIQIIKLLHFFEPIIGVYTDKKLRPLFNYIAEDERLYLKEAKKELQQFFDTQLTESPFGTQLIRLMR